MLRFADESPDSERARRRLLFTAGDLERDFSGESRVRDRRERERAAKKIEKRIKIQKIEVPTGHTLEVHACQNMFHSKFGRVLTTRT